MKIIEISALENGSHNNQTSSGVIPVPDGWAVIPDSMTIPDTFPFVNITVENAVVTSMTAGTVPEPEPEPEPAPTTEDRVSALEAENKTLKAQVSALTDQNDFQEELIVELAGVVYA